MPEIKQLVQHVLVEKLHLWSSLILELSIILEVKGKDIILDGKTEEIQQHLIDAAGSLSQAIVLIDETQRSKVVHHD